MDASLHADLSGTRLPRLEHSFGDLLRAERERVGIRLALGEGTEPAAGVADIGEVDIAVDHERHLVADSASPQVVGHLGDGIHLVTGRGEQRQRQRLVRRSAQRARIVPGQVQGDFAKSPTPEAAGIDPGPWIWSHAPKAVSKSLRCWVSRPRISMVIARSVRPAPPAAKPS